jgi:hypothetical protein
MGSHCRDSSAQRVFTTREGDRLSPGISIIVIAALAALSWAVLIVIVMAVFNLV